MIRRKVSVKFIEFFACFDMIVCGKENLSAERKTWPPRPKQQPRNPLKLTHCTDPYKLDLNSFNNAVTL